MYNNKKMLLCEYIRLIKQKYIKRKTKQFVEEIVVYTHDKVVYKVVVRYYDLMNKLRKLGIDHYIQILTDIPKTKITDELITNHTKYSNLTIIYNSRTQISTVVPGEEQTSITKAL